MGTGRNRKIEILAPAGSFDALQAAVMAGCDAVYIGGSRFGARAYADNPGEDELLRAIDYAHLYGVKVYLTVNTLLKEDELLELTDYLMPYYLQGVDAVIVQDFGVMKLLSEKMPGLPLHASTQMTITNPETCRLLPKEVTRVVPARELTLTELTRLREKTDLEIEVFCHGALCYSYSGQCLMSSMIGGRSGNRGRCAQPCRKEYRLTSEDGKRQGYFLSPKDQCMLAFLPKLLAAGVDSLKIEGRMKSPVYAAGVVSVYRKWVDRLLERKGEGYRKEERAELQEDIRLLAELYNRGGFSAGYPFTETGREMMSTGRPNHSGVAIGTATLTGNGRQARVHYREKTSAGDVLELRISDNGREQVLAEYTAGAEEMQQVRTVPLFGNRGYGKAFSVPNGEITVYRTRNDALLTQIEERYRTGSRRRVLFADFFAKVGEPMTLVLTGEHTISVTGDVVEAARKAPATEEGVREKLQKTGETVYSLEPVHVHLQGDVFLPVSKINELRRASLEQYSEHVLSFYRRKKPEGEADVSECPEDSRRRLMHPDSVFQCAGRDSGSYGLPKVLASVMTVKQLRAAQSHKAVSGIYIDMDGDYRSCLRELGELPYCLVLPHITQGERLEQLRGILNELFDGNEIQRPAGIVVRTPDALQMLRECWPQIPLIADYTLYSMNSAAAKWLLSQGICRITAPLEENEKELSWIADYPNEMIIYGRTVVMTSKQCVQKTTAGCRKQAGRVFLLTDEKGAGFPVQTCCETCMNRIYNSEVLNLLPYLGQMGQMNPQGFRIEFTIEDAKEVTAVLNAMEAFSLGNPADSHREGTRGHFKRGVL